MKKTSAKKVAVAMSGGVDSSVAALLLKEQGFDVHGFFMRNWSPLSELPNDCPWQKDYEDARKVCNYIGIPYATFNFEKEYKERVLNNFLREYQAGRTPNPDILCNKEIKFDVFWKKAKSLGFDHMATGHYAKLEASVESSEIRLVRPKDGEKDQTYFLCKLTPEQLKHVLFPLCDLTKTEVRKIAQRAGLPNANKKDSQGICFIGKLPVREFLKNSLDLKPGKVMATDGSILGEHEGAQLYTIGQRHIGVAANGKKMYVANIDTATNTVVMAEEASLYTKAISFGQSRWFIDLPENFECDIQTRYRTPLLPATVSKNGIVRLKRPARAVTPGQYIAFYKIDQLIGSAVIS